jgi:hypothetical protein
MKSASRLAVGRYLGEAIDRFEKGALPSNSFRRCAFSNYHHVIRAYFGCIAIWSCRMSKTLHFPDGVLLCYSETTGNLKGAVCKCKSRRRRIYCSPPLCPGDTTLVALGSNAGPVAQGVCAALTHTKRAARQMDHSVILRGSALSAADAAARLAG